VLAEIWNPGMKVVFVGTVVTELSDTLGFYHLDPRDRFWEFLKMSAITPQQVLSGAEMKAVADGHREGSVSDPVRAMFIEKKTSQLIRFGIGLTVLNRRVNPANEKDKFALPAESDITEFLARAGELKPVILAFTTVPDVFVESFRSRFPAANDTLGPQPFAIGTSEVWLLGSTTSRLRGDAIASQEDAFFELGERVQSLSQKPGGGD
jgi:G:T/U-mismatch repair DNA glycosylase